MCTIHKYQLSLLIKWGVFCLNANISSLQGSLQQIYSFSQSLDESLITSIKSYLNLSDKKSSDDAARQIRKNATDAFIKLYKACALKGLVSTDALPLSVNLFLNTGFMDETLFSENQLSDLCDIIDMFTESSSVYTYFDWLKSIYTGKNESSIDEFSVDYVSSVREQKKNGQIDNDKMNKLLSDNIAKVMYELNKVLLIQMKTLSFSPLVFCPILTPDCFYKNILSFFVEQDDWEQQVYNVKAVDYSLFYKEYMYSNPEQGVEKAFIETEVLPSIILLPCFASKGMMWQECEGANRRTSARFIFPIFFEGDLHKTMIQVCANYRWEMCKRVQGARWSDLTDKSLTSAFYNYSENYKKNSQMSPEIRERVRKLVEKNRKNSKNVFVDCYAMYVQSESRGMVKLDKFARQILFDFCPFSGMVLSEGVSKHPLYADIVANGQKELQHKLHLNDLLTNRIEKDGYKVPSEVAIHANLLKKGLML